MQLAARSASMLEMESLDYSTNSPQSALIIP